MADGVLDIAAPGIKADPGLAQELRKQVAHLLKRQHLKFPGAQPVSFSRWHLDELRQKDYYVCEKSDGIRYLLFLTVDSERNQEAHYLIDRRNDYWFVPPGRLHLPLEKDEQGFHTNSLVDGELVLENTGAKSSGRPPQPKFLVFDCLVLDGKDLMERTLDKRLAYFKQGVWGPYNALFKKYPEELAFQLFRMEMKVMQFSYATEMMFREIIPNLKHGNDGLIFTCRDSEYRPGTDPHILKWKPVEENTVDFRIKLRFPIVEPDADEYADAAVEGLPEPERYTDWDAVPEAELLANEGQGRYQRFADCHIEEEEWEKLKALGDPISNRVVECGLDKQGRWRIHRFRDDKPDANHISVVESVMDSIRDSVSAQELIDAAKVIKEHWKSRQATRGR